MKIVIKKRIVATVAVSLALILSGAGLFVFTARSMATSEVSMPSVQVTPKPTSVTPTRIEGNPTKIDIPSLGISLPVIPGVFDSKTGKWTLTTDKVQYASMTPLPNDQEGNTFLYGHYRKNIFASLHTITPGAVATVTTDNGHVFYYEYVSNRVVDPTDSAGVFDYKGGPILTVQTCTGVTFQKRHLFTFNLIRVV